MTEKPDLPHKNTPASLTSDSHKKKDELKIKEEELKGDIQKLESHTYFRIIKKIFGYIFRYVFPIAVSVCLLLWLFNKVNFHQVMDIAHKGCNYWYIGIMMVVTVFSLMVRGVRWGLQLRAAGVKRMTIVCEWVTLWGAYALNLIFPQMGEAWRCVFVSKRQKAPLSTVVGTDIGDRFIDWLIIMVLFVIALIVAHPYIMDFMEHYQIGREVKKVVDNPYLWISVGGSIAFIVALLYFFKEKKWAQSIILNIRRMWEGFSIIFRMKLWWLYLLLSILTWVCYFVETYICFYAFKYTTDLVHQPGLAYALIPGLVVCVFAALSMGIPSNGGLGPWNLAVMFALSLFGINNTDGTAFSIVVWSFQAITFIACGLFALGYIMVTDKKIKAQEESEAPGISSNDTTATNQ